MTIRTDTVHNQVGIWAQWLRPFSYSHGQEIPSSCIQHQTVPSTTSPSKGFGQSEGPPCQAKGSTCFRLTAADSCSNLQIQLLAGSFPVLTWAVLEPTYWPRQHDGRQQHCISPALIPAPPKAIAETASYSDSPLLLPAKTQDTRAIMKFAHFGPNLDITP